MRKRTEKWYLYPLFRPNPKGFKPNLSLEVEVNVTRRGVE